IELALEMQTARRIAVEAHSYELCSISPSSRRGRFARLGAAPLLALMSSGFCLLACSPGGTSDGAGGAPGSGGALASGGAVGSGGAPAVGGSATGGSAAGGSSTGGVASVGGSSGGSTDSGSGGQSDGTPVGDHGQLSVVGTKLTNAGGQPVQLK